MMGRAGEAAIDVMQQRGPYEIVVMEEGVMRDQAAWTCSAFSPLTQLGHRFALRSAPPRSESNGVGDLPAARALTWLAGWLLLLSPRRHRFTSLPRSLSSLLALHHALAGFLCFSPPTPPPP